MGKGRRPTPPELKKLLGMGGSSKRESVNFQKGIPPCPRTLDPAARKVWREAVKEVLSREILCKVDGATLAAYCVAVSILRQAQDLLEREGLTFTTLQGGIKRHPAVAIVHSYSALVRSLGAEFGFNPASRSRLAAPKKAGDEFDEWRNGSRLVGDVKEPKEGV